ncbi:MAG: hypothetical protein Kow0092_39470 [Deferrisomatales bacterium]
MSPSVALPEGTRRRGARWALVGALSLFAAAAPAAETPGGPPEPGAGVRVRMEEVRIQGEVERPDVFYIIPRRQVRIEASSRTRDFRPEIAEPLLPEAFEAWVRARRAR